MLLPTILCIQQMHVFLPVSGKIRPSTLIFVCQEGRWPLHRHQEWVDESCSQAGGGTSHDGGIHRHDVMITCGVQICGRALKAPATLPEVGSKFWRNASRLGSCPWL